MADYKILQNIDLAQNEIKEVSKISNDRSDGKDKKKLLIQTGDNTSLTFSRKVGENSNYIKGIVKEENSESIFNVEPSKIEISNQSTTESSSLVLGLNTAKKEHIEAVSPLVDIKTGDTEYTDPHISLSQNSLNLKSTEISLNSKKTDKPSSITLNEGITEKSDTITLQSKSKYDTTKDKDYFTVSLNKTTDNKGNISLSAKDSITESVGNRSISIGTSDIVIEDSTTSGTESKIEVNNKGIKASKGSDSYIDISYNDIEKQVEIEEKSNKVTIKTPNKVTLTLNESSNGSASLTSKGTITLTSQGDAETKYDNNIITTKADTITIKAKGYEGKKGTEYYPHIELKSTKNTDPVNSILLEGKTINISSKDKDSNAKDNIKLSGTKLNVESTTTEVTSKDIKVQHKETVLKDGESKEEDILVLEISNNSDSKLIRVPTTTEVDINSTKIGIGDTNSTTTISGSTLEVTTPITNITSTSTLSGTTTLQSSKPTSEKPTPENTLKVDTESTSITGLKAEINSSTVEIGTTTTKGIIIGRPDSTTNEGVTTTLQSQTTSITSPTLNVTSPTVKFGENTNQTVSFNGTGTVTSNVNTSVVGKTFSVKNESNNDILKADTTSVSLAGSSTTITSGSIGIGVSDTTTGITIGKDVGSNITTLQSEETKITSPTVNIGTGTTTSLNIGNTNATVTFEGNNNLSITSDTSTSNVTAKTLKFEKNISSNDIKIRWDSTLNSLVFEKV